MKESKAKGKHGTSAVGFMGSLLDRALGRPFLSLHFPLHSINDTVRHLMKAYSPGLKPRGLEIWGAQTNLLGEAIFI